MSLPSTTSGMKVLDDLTKLSREAKYYAEGFKNLKQLNSKLKELESLKRGVSSVTQSIKDLEKQFSPARKLVEALNTDVKKLNEKYKIIERTVKSLKEVADNLKSGNFKKVSPNLNQAVTFALALGAAGLVLMSIKNQEEIQAIELRKEDFQQREFNSVFQRILKNTFDLKTVNSKIDKLNKEIDRNNAEVGGAIKNSTDARQKANDALYEVRQGKVKLDAQVTEAKKKANDALYEVRQGRVKLDAQVTEANKKANDALYETRQGRSKLENQIQSLQNEFKRVTSSAGNEFQKQIQNTVVNITKELASVKQQSVNAQAKVDKIEPKVNIVEKVVTTVQNTVSGLQSTVQTVQKQSEQFGVQVTTFTAKLADVTSGLTIYKAQVIEPRLADVTQSQFSTSARVDNLERVIASNEQQIQIIKDIDNSFEGRAREWNEQINKQREALFESNKFSIVEISNIKNTTKQDLEQVKQDLNKVKQDLSNAKQDLTKVKPEIDKLKKDINEQDKMNREGLSKLDQITPLALLIPGLADRTANKVKEFTPTISDIEKAAATGTCRTTQPGGCTRKAIDDAVGNINANTNQNTNNILDGINTTANAAQLALLQGIDNKLGPLLPDGGISSFLQKFFDRFNKVAEWLHLDRLLNILVFAATVHNAFMLSNNIGQTLMGAINNVLQLIGLKDAKGGNIDIGQIINSTVEGIVKGIVGEQNYQTISTAWAKANRIYQATTNVLNAFQNVSNTILSGLELIGGYTGKIGNALKKAGEVLDNAYGWMNPQPKFNRITQTLENLQQGASTIQQVTQVPLDVINAVTELQTANTELVKAIKEDSKPENKGISAPEPEKLKADELASKLANRISNISSEDKFNGAD